MAIAIHDKDPRSSQEFEAYVQVVGRDATVERYDPVSAYPRHKVSPAQTVETIAKWLDLPFSLTEIKSGRNTFFRLCLIFNSRNRKAIGSRKVITTTIARLSGEFWPAIGRKGRNALALRARAFWNERPIPLRSLYTKVWLFAKLSSKTNRLSKR